VTSSSTRTELAEAPARNSSDQALTLHLKLLIAKVRLEKFGRSSERAKQLDQLELQLESLVAEDDCAAQTAAAYTSKTAVPAACKRPVRTPLPDHLPPRRQSANDCDIKPNAPH